MDNINTERTRINREINIFINKLKWKTANNEFTMKMFKTDCFLYEFKTSGLEHKEQVDLLEFIDNAENLNKITVIDFCKYLYQHKIYFKLKFRYCKGRNVIYNMKCAKLVRLINQRATIIEKADNKKNTN